MSDQRGMRTLRCIILLRYAPPPVLHHLSAEREEKYTYQQPPTTH